MESNHRLYGLPLAQRPIAPGEGCSTIELRTRYNKTGAWGGNRTPDACAFNAALYQLSYPGINTAYVLVPRAGLEPARPSGHQALNLARLPNFVIWAMT